MKMPLVLMVIQPEETTVAEVAEHVRHFRLKENRDKAHRLEVHIVPGTPAAQIWECMAKILREEGAKRRHGGAPPGEPGRVIQKWLDDNAEV